MRALPLLTVSVTLLCTRAATGATCYALRPTEAGAAWSYAGAPATAFDTADGNVRVWYALEGRHAPEAAAAGHAPLAVLEAGAAAQAALARFIALGFRRPLPDGPDSPCPEAGGDARLDIYLYDFDSADGTIVVDQCTDGGLERCAGFAVVENDFLEKGYASASEGFRTVVPHELFHLVQYAYATDSEAWWAEGTAQWAAKQVFPELKDLEGFLPAFFQRADRPIDFPPVGAAAAFSYGAAIWPVFLTERFEAPVVRGVFEALGAGAAGALDATDRTLQGAGSSLAAAFSDFAVWNAVTGTRAGSSGYASAASYPEVTLEALPVALPSNTSGALAGLSARYFRFLPGERRRLQVSGDAQRLNARFVPLVENAARVLQLKALPLETSSAGIVVLSGRARDHRDVSFTIHVDEASSTAGGAANEGVTSAGATGAGDMPASGAAGVEASQGEGGIGEASEPAEPLEGGKATLVGAVVSGRPRASGGCSTARALHSRASPTSVFASIVLAIGLGRLAEGSTRLSSRRRHARSRPPRARLSTAPCKSTP
jgi:hypothetical protein